MGLSLSSLFWMTKSLPFMSFQWTNTFRTHRWTVIHTYMLTRWQEGREREKNQTHIEPLCIVKFVCFHHENTQSGKLMNSTCACATFAQKMEALKEKHRYFMQFSLKDDCILFFSPASFRSFARAIAIWWLRCHHCFCFLASLFLCTPLFVFSLPSSCLFFQVDTNYHSTGAWKMWSGYVTRYSPLHTFCALEK